MNEEREKEERGLQGGLGDLPEPILEERQEFGAEPGSLFNGEQRIKGDLLESAAQAPTMVSPDPDVSVQSVYDARPINAVDFIIPLFCHNVSGVFSGNTFVVPPGLVCLLKWFTLEQVGGTNIDLVNQFGSLIAVGKQFSILVNKVPQPNFALISLGPFSEKYPCYIFAPENALVEFQLTN